MNPLTIRIRVTEEDDGTWSGEVGDRAVKCARHPTRSAAIAAAQAVALQGLAEQLNGGITEVLAGGIEFDVRSPRRRVLQNPESKPGSHRILVVEDEEAIRALMRRSLEGAGFRVLEATDVAEAVALLERDVTRVDLLITDVILPGESGIELLHLVESRFPTVRVMLVSGYAPSLPGRGQPFEPGIPFLPKPFTTEQLVGKVREVLKTRAPVPREDPDPAVPAPRRARPPPGEPREDLARVLLAAPNPAEARFIGNYLESVGDHRVRVETASTARQVRRMTARRTYELILVDHALLAEEPTLIGELAAHTPVVTLQPAAAPGAEPGDTGPRDHESDSGVRGGPARPPSLPRSVVRRESAMLSNLARAVSRLVGLPEPSDEARAARRHEFVDVVCHDLRNPASTIAGYTELLLDRNRATLSRDQSNALERIRRNAYFMLDLIESILDTERLEAGDIHAALGPLDLVGLVRDTIDDFRPMAESKAIGLVADLPVDPVLVSVDPRLFSRAVSNLISNAIKFSPAESRIEVGLAVRADQVAIRVRDQGPGIPTDEQGRLFTKFGRTSVLATRGEHQTGLGLFIVKRIMDLHGARILVDSAPGRGSEFRILIKPDHCS